MRHWVHDHGMFEGAGGRTAILVSGAGIVLVSLLVGQGLVGGPEPMRILCAFCALFIIPGAALTKLIFRAALSPVEVVSGIFAMGLIFSSAVVCIGFIPGISYAVISVTAAAVAIVLVFIACAKRGRRGTSGSDSCRLGNGSNRGGPRSARFMLLCVGLYAICFLLFFKSGELGPWSDAPDHVSYVSRSVESDTLFPRDSFYRDGDGVSFDMRKGLWHPVLSLWTYQSHAPADRAWRMVPACSVFFVLASFLGYALELCGSRLCAAVSLAFLVLFYRGEGLVWLTKLGFSRNMAQTLFWIDLAFLLKYYRARERAYLLATVLITCVGAAFHVAFALLLGASFLALFAYVTFVRDGRAWRPAFWRSVPLQLAALGAPLAVRAHAAAAGYNMIHMHRQGMLVFSDHLAVVDPARLVTAVGVVFFFGLLMAPFFFVITRPGRRRALVWVLFVVPVLIVLNPVTGPLMERRIGYLYYRILEAAPLMPLLALMVLGLGGMVVFGKRRGAGESLKPGGSGSTARSIVTRVAAAVVLALFLYYPFRGATRQLSGSAHAMVFRERETTTRYERLCAALGERIPSHSVVAADPLTSYLLSAYTDYFVVVTLDQHGSPADTSALDRLRNVRDLLSPAVPLSANCAWLARSGADYVLLDTRMSDYPDFFGSVVPGSTSLTCDKFAACGDVMSERLDVEGFRLFEVHRESLSGVLDRACSVPRAAALVCDREGGEERRIVDSELDVGCGIVLSCLMLDAFVLNPGDTLRGQFCWRTSQPLSFGLPLEVIVRIDSEYPRGAWYRPSYGKQYRRVVERRNNHLYRYTWSERLMSGFTYPDQWEPIQIVRQDFSLPISPWMAPGTYELRIKVLRRPYLMNRVVADYLRNDDSQQGIVVAEVTVGSGVGR
jgi:hypothetical protein